MEARSNNEIARRVAQLRQEIDEAAQACGRDPSEIRLMAVTKTQTPELVNQAIDAGIHLLGENRAQELLEKFDDYHKEGVEIHFIGHLQSNKVRQIIDKVSLIHSVDSLSLAQEIDRQAQKHDKIMKILVEVNIGGEESKSGVAPEKLEELLDQLSSLRHISVQGLMCIPPRCQNPQDSAAYFEKMQQLFIDIKRKNNDNMNMSILSMGMSGDYKTAIRYGSTLVRIGTALFGERK